MKPLVSWLRGFPESSQSVRIPVFICAILFAFYFGKNWSSGPNSIHQIIFNSSFQNIYNSTPPRVILSPSSTFAPTPLTSSPQLSPPPHPSTYGIIDDYGNMGNDFNVDDFDPGLIGSIDCNSSSSRSDNSSEDKNSVVDSKKSLLKKFRVCEESKREYIPCLDNLEEIEKLKSTEKGERFGRLCPKTGLDCLIPKPMGYKTPVPWPQSRDER